MNPTDIKLEVKIPPETRYLSLVGNLAELLAKEIEDCSGNRETLAYRLDLVLTEAITNAIRHAQSADVQETVRVIIDIQECDVYIRVFDHGQGFDIKRVASPEFDELNEHGRGIFILRTFMDSVDYYQTDTGNVLEMRKKLPCEEKK